MTDPAQGRNEPASVAALAIHVSALRREVGRGAAQANALTIAQREHAVALASLAVLRRQVEQILAILSEQDDDAPAAWFWLTMSERECNAKLAELVDWVEIVLRKRYPTTSPASSGHAGPTTPKPGGSWPGSTSSGPWPTWLTGQPPRTPPTGTTAGFPA